MAAYLIPSQLQSFVLADIEEVGKVLGKGAYGEVLEMRMQGLRVAGKKLYNSFFQGTTQKVQQHLSKRFEEECIRMSKVRHPNIVEFLGVHLEPGSSVPVLIMELLPLSLTSFLSTHSDIPADIKHSILFDVSLGLFYLHCHSPPIIHRDLTANNILLTFDLKAKIADLGVARIVDPDCVQRQVRLTTCPGLLSYMPPEALTVDDSYLVETDHCDKLDIFSFGVLILHVCIQNWPLPTNPFQRGTSVPLSEIQRREHHFCKMEPDSVLRRLAEDCLQNEPRDRPTIANISDKLSGLPRRKVANFNTHLEALQALDKQKSEIHVLSEKLINMESILQKERREKLGMAEAHASEVKFLQQQLDTLKNAIVQSVPAKSQKPSTSFVDLSNETFKRRAMTMIQGSELRPPLALRPSSSLGGVTHESLQLDYIHLFTKSRSCLSGLSQHWKTPPLTQQLVCKIVQLSYDVSKDTLIKLLLAEARRCITQSTTQSSEDRDSSAPHDIASPELLQKRAGILELLKRTVFSTSGNEPSPNEEQMMDLIKAALISLFMCPADSGQPVSEGSLKDLHSALLLTSGATHMHHLIAGDELLQEIVADLNPRCQAVMESKPRLLTFINDSIKLSWKAVSLSPPAIISQPPTFNNQWHTKRAPYWDESGSCQLVYFKPVLFFSSSGDVGHKGEVGNHPMSKPSYLDIECSCQS